MPHATEMNNVPTLLMPACLYTHSSSVHLWDLRVHPCTMVFFGRHVKVCMDHDLSQANLLPSCSCFEKELGSQVQQDVPYSQNHSVMLSKEIYHNGQFSDQSAQWGLHEKLWSTVESSLKAPRQNASRGGTLLWGEYLWDISTNPNTLDSIKEVPTVLFYKVKSKIVNVP